MSTAVGKRAEDEAENYLVRAGYEILARNWRTRWCEIDIVARKNDAIYFVEVKYRSSEQWGSGLDYITARKQQQMHFAAEYWVASHRFNGDYHLAAISLTSNPPEVIDWLDDI